jgi:heterodisulfide reductase subunit A-like polyferredoxin
LFYYIKFIPFTQRSAGNLAVCLKKILVENAILLYNDKAKEKKTFLGGYHMKQMEADVVLVGGGMSGLCAATQAQESLNATGGGSVVVFEKSGTIGGAANMGMAFFAVESQMQKESMTNNYPLVSSITAHLDRL